MMHSDITSKKKRFSMIREFHLADWVTLANSVCGTSALFSIMTYLQVRNVKHILYACSLILAALFFDILDGRVARWRQKTSVMGRE
ncbi:MAG: CDP-alcohol phosphatidyltransferase family protein, partial [Syntrophales bacterium]|nr:CDP-alcohol phosphatidyltransferase family protein [Syntrophales bacterium]